MLFDVICDDKPWPYAKLKKDATAKENSDVGFVNYDTMSLKDMFDMKDDVQAISKPGTLLFSWVAWPFLEDCIAINDFWGFDFITCAYIWVKVYNLTECKPVFGQGRHTASNTEACLLFRRKRSTGQKAHFRDKLTSQMVLEPETIIDTVLGHSRKPDEVYKRIEEYYVNATRLEMFGRKARDKWVVIGKESPSTPNQDIRASLQQLARM